MLATVDTVNAALAEENKRYEELCKVRDKLKEELNAKKMLSIVVEGRKH